MEYSAELVRLEEFVDKLLTKYNQLKSDCHALQDTLRQRDAECAELKGKVFELSAERTEVSNKVNGLLGRIEQWENEQTAANSEASEVRDDSQGSLFHGDSEGKAL